MDDSLKKLAGGLLTEVPPSGDVVKNVKETLGTIKDAGLVTELFTADLGSVFFGLADFWSGDDSPKKNDDLGSHPV